MNNISDLTFHRPLYDICVPQEDQIPEEKSVSEVGVKPEIIKELFVNRDNIEEVYGKYEIEKDPFDDFYEVQNIQHTILWTHKEFIKEYPSLPETLVDQWPDSFCSQVSHSFHVLKNKLRDEKWDNRVNELYARYLEGCLMEIDEPFEVTMKDLDGLSVSVLGPDQDHLEELKKDVEEKISSMSKVIGFDQHEG